MATIRSASTTWGWKKVKIATRPEGHTETGPKALRWRFRPPRNPRDPLTITVKFRGGPECWYEVRSRGSMGRFPGHVALHDAIDEINRGGGSRDKT